MTLPRIDGATSRRAQARVAAAPPFELALTELDLDVLAAVCGLRVVTQTQLERLYADVAPRTLRYRTRRLHEAGLIGRTRPYRESGSAPHHLWPTNRADALTRGRRPARRGERRTPNPLFLAHAAALSELYVVLRTASPLVTGWTLDAFQREGAAREDFHDANGEPHAIVPDAGVGLRLRERRSYVTYNIELDLGTMTHARLRAKLRCYLAHAAWRARMAAAPAPALLFITTSGVRRDRFLQAAVDIQSEATDPAARGLLIAASAEARQLDGAVEAPCWRVAGRPESHTLCALAGPASAARTTHPSRMAS